MKRRLTGGAGSDSLELLLDTLCNVFGGIVLISCLLAIIPRQQAPPPLPPAHSVVGEMIERRIIGAREEAVRMTSEIDRLSKTTDPRLLDLQARRNSLRTLQEGLERSIKEKQNKEINEAEARSLVALEKNEILEKSLVELRLQKSKTEILHIAAIDKIRFLEQRIKCLSDETAKLAKGRMQAVRFPRERKPEGRAFPIIIRYNAVYPIALDGDMRPNPALERIPKAGDHFRARPIPGQGVASPNNDRDLHLVLRAAARENCYASLYLYPDSHGVFAELLEALAESGLNYGLEFVGRGQELSFGPEGNAPPEL